MTEQKQRHSIRWVGTGRMAYEVAAPVQASCDVSVMGSTTEYQGSRE